MNSDLGRVQTGLGQGFDRVLWPREKTWAAGTTVDQLIDWLPQADGRPLFCWLHVFDAHFPYEPPEELRRAYYPDDADPFSEELPEPVESGRDLGFEVEADDPGGIVVLQGARIVTMRDADDTREIIEDGVVVVNGNRIEAVGKAGEVAIPQDDVVVLDLSGKTIIPGLVDVHADVSEPESFS